VFARFPQTMELFFICMKMPWILRLQFTVRNPGIEYLV
jgi:hypothetical protein